MTDEERPDAPEEGGPETSDEPPEAVTKSEPEASGQEAPGGGHPAGGQGDAPA